MATLNQVFTNIANAIRNKTGKSATMTPAEMTTEIGKLSDTSTDTVSADKMLSGIAAHDKSGEKITGNIGTYDGSYECSGESTGGSGGGDSGGVCPSLMIHADVNPWLIGASVYLKKVTYYSNGELQTLTAYDEYNKEIGLGHLLTEQSYEIQNVDINKPIIIQADNNGERFINRLQEENDNINIIFNSLPGFETWVGVFTITDENSTAITIYVEF